MREFLVKRTKLYKTDGARASGLGKLDRNKAVACANVDVLVAGAPTRRFCGADMLSHTVGVCNFGILDLRFCTRPVSVMAKPALPDTEKKSGRVQSSKEHAQRYVDVSTIKMYKLVRREVGCKTGRGPVVMIDGTMCCEEHSAGLYTTPRCQCAVGLSCRLAHRRSWTGP